MTTQDIEHVYQETSATLKAISQKRNATLFFQKMMWLLMGMYFVGATLVVLSAYFPEELKWLSVIANKLLGSTKKPYQQLYYLLPLLILISINSYFFSGAFYRFKTLEMNTISKMIKQLFPQAEFSQTSQINNNITKESKLFAWIKTNTPVYTFGQMRTSINGTYLNIADIGFIENHIGNKLINSSLKIPLLNMPVVIYQYILKNIVTSKTSDAVYFSFRGMYCWANFNKKLTTRTIVIPNSLTTRLDRFASFNFKDDEKIALEDARFNSHFSVYSPDQIESRYVLSSSVMEKITTLKERFNRNIMLSFINNKVFLAVENPNGIFSFPSGKLDSIEIIEELIAEIHTAQSMVTELKLNR